MKRRSPLARGTCSHKTDAGRRPVRLLGVSVQNLEKTDVVTKTRRPLTDPVPRLPLDDGT